MKPTEAAGRFPLSLLHILSGVCLEERAQELLFTTEIDKGEAV
jgi:hypothetical protein